MEDSKLLIAIIAAAASLAGALATATVAYLSARRAASEQRRLEEQRATAHRELEEAKSLLALAASERNARQAYEYEAKKRLYSEAEPLLFQFFENAAYAINRIRNMARASRSGELPGWLDGSKPYYLHSTLHSFLVPLASIHLLRDRLTSLDLTLDARIERQYEIGKALSRTYNRDALFAAEAPAISLTGADVPTPRGAQGVVGGEVQRAVSAVINTDGEKPRIKAFWEFSADLADSASAASQAVAIFSAPFRDFAPAQRPVFWRILIAQLFLLRAARLQRVPDLTNTEVLRRVTLSPEEMKEFAFSHDPTDAAEVDAGYAIAMRFLETSLNYQDPFRS